MARTVRNPKIDTRSARARLPGRREPYWTVLSQGCALGYRRGAKGGTGLLDSTAMTAASIMARSVRRTMREIPMG